ncbi:PREDICTED: carboxypeptidase M [Nanorana parkeri]|uniref:carboxypeptidase M n=1 Tax=Nanorana parkeri TaxID=125878 RepID=UPI00085460DB|nr:PREDICTED: carboxypeptidase M [Nanorana parkeri]
MLMTVACLGFFALSVQSLEFTYHHFPEMERVLKDFNTKYPAITNLYSIGKSVKGRDLWVFVVGLYPTEHKIGIPDFKYIANMHGNEVVGRELMLHLIEYLLINYQSDPVIKQMVNKARIHIMPSMNPDGFEIAEVLDCSSLQGRYNDAGIDLNRNFPDPFADSPFAIQPETKAIIDWVKEETFVLSANFHGGALVASYPYDNSANGKTLLNYSNHTVPPDIDVLKYLAETYSNNHATMSKPNDCASIDFTGGITNGFSWYPVEGGMQDYNYVFGQCLEITLELSCCKYPNDSLLEQHWRDNKVAMIEYMKKVHMGIKGQVFDTDGKPVMNAIVDVQGRKRICPYRTNKYGEYYYLLLPGTYTFNVSVQNATILTKITIPESVDFSAMTYNFQFKVMTGDTIPLTTSCSATERSSSSSSSTLKTCLLTILLKTVLILFVNAL